VVVYKYMPVYVTPLMVIRACQDVADGGTPHWQHRWVPLDSIAQCLPQAVMTSEDQLFMQHHGFDLEQIQKAQLAAERGKRRRGASTISQQTAKNVFLWPNSSWTRKGFEFYFTILIEQIWGKERIMEVYLNSIEMGHNLYGAEATSRVKFGTKARDLSPYQAALIASTLPSPLKRDSAHPTAFMRKRAHSIKNDLNAVDRFPGGYVAPGKKPYGKAIPKSQKSSQTTKKEK